MRRSDLEMLDDEYAASLAERQVRYQAMPLVADDKASRIASLRTRRPRRRLLDRALGYIERLKATHPFPQDFYGWSDFDWSKRKRRDPRAWRNRAIYSGVPEMWAAALALKRHERGILTG